MAQRDISTFKATKDSRYSDNTSGGISEQDSRDMFEDVADSFLNITDHLVDEDDMDSDSATKVPSQQSVKAYVNAVAGSAGDVSSGVATFPVGNTGTGKDELFSLSTALLNSARKTLHVIIGGTYAANANNKTISVELGSTEIFNSGALAINNGNWRIEIIITASSTTFSRANVTFITDSTLLPVTTKFVTTTELLGVDLVLYGEGTSNSDILTSLEYWTLGNGRLYTMVNP